MESAARTQRRQDLLLAADALRRQIGADLTHLQPAADRALAWFDVGLWLRRHWASSTPELRRIAALLAVVAGVSGGGFALRHARWLRHALAGWRLWKLLRA